jgi:hypothetical protein
MIVENKDDLIIDDVESGGVTTDPKEIVEEISDNLDEGSEGSEEEDEEIVITFGDEKPDEEEPVQDSSVIQGLRKANRDQAKKIKEFEHKQATEKKPVELGERPTIENCGWDEDKLSSETDKWFEKKQEVGRLEAERTSTQETQTKAWQEKLSSYAQFQTELKVKDFEDVEDVVKDSLSTAKQGLILQGSKNSAKLVYALGKNPKKLAELKAIKDDVEFIFAVAKMEASLKVSTRKPKTGPEPRTKGSGGTAGAVDNVKARLVKEAIKTGNFSKVHAYNKSQQNKK